MKTGTYSLAARVVVQHRHAPLSGLLTIGLLTKAPTPEGSSAIELDTPGYVRQPINFSDPVTTGGTIRSGVRASFGPIGDNPHDVQHAAIFNAAGEIVAYGLIEHAPGWAGPWEVAFEASAVQVRF